MKTFRVSLCSKPKERAGSHWFPDYGEWISSRQACRHPFSADKDAILYLNSPDGISAHARRNMLDRLKELHELQLEKTGDPGLETKIAQYEMGFECKARSPK